MSAVEKRRLLQLMICGSIFVLMVGVKLLLPGKLSVVGGKVSTAIERNMDVAQVFSAVGELVSGEKDVGQSLEDVYQAVFAPEEATVQKTGGEPLPAKGQVKQIGTAGQEDRTAAPLDGAEGQEALELSSVWYSAENLPDNVQMEQAVLGFDYAVPLEGTLSSAFGYREHPLEGEDRFHYGVDLAADEGTAICCFAEGTVRAVGESSSYGKYLIVDHEDGYATLYAHCSAISARSGEAVERGEEIAKVGDTGMATGAHLHFELQREDTYFNPVYYVLPV